MQEIIRFINQHQIMSIIWIILLVMLILTILKDITSKVKIITRIEAIHLINKDDAIVLDLRRNQDFLKGRIAGSINLPINKIKDDDFNEIFKYKDRPIVIVDNIESLQTIHSANALYRSGFRKVFILKDGILGWNAENLPLIHKNYE